MRNLVYMSIAIVMLTFALFVGYKEYQKLKKDNERLSKNMENINFELEKNLTKNKEVFYSVNSLILKKSELEKMNSSLVNDLKGMGLKLKNIENISQFLYKYTGNIDSIQSKEILNAIDSIRKADVTKPFIPTNYKFEHSDKFVSFNGIINTENYPARGPKIKDLKFNITDSLNTIYEIQYKRSWIFWKKAVGLKLHIKSENPYFELDQTKTYRIQNKNGL